MFCDQCSKLAIIIGGNTKICIRCNSVIMNNISCVCEKCAKENGQCSVCLKRLGIIPRAPSKGCGCGGGKK